jgi:DNA helicase II / ATP-dependent DNA helicase PcrA
VLHMAAPELNPQQRLAVESIAGPLLVLAGAGAGKTRVIAERIRNIIRHGVAPESILAITFTNKAAAEMRTRIAANAARDQGRGPFVSTFHSLGLTLIKENARLLGFKRTPAIYDRADSLREMKQALKATGNEDIEARVALSVASRNKGEGVGADEYAEAASSWRDKAIAAAWLKYEAALRAEGALDFDDLLLRAVELLEKHLEIREQYQRRWMYLHVDEYQDTNAIQARLAELLVGSAKNICVVGDIDQTIYGWRGAQIENMLQFEKKFGGEVITLEQNYRSTKAILAAANQLIGNNTNRPEKNLFTNNADGEPLSLYIAGDGGDEALFVAHKIQELLRSGAKPQDFAVLYRANFQSRAIEEKLLDARIPYQVLGTRFFERKEVKDVLSFVRGALTENAADVGRVIDTLPGIGKVTKLKILAGQEAALTGKIRERVAAMRHLLQNIRAEAERSTPSNLLRTIIAESGVEAALKEDKLEGGERLENLAELVSLASRYDALPVPEGLEQFLESAALASDQDELKEEKNQVRLMTVHAAKGLEFPYVFIIGLEEGLFPYEREDDTKESLEEERRLMYVALTRAEKKLYLSYAMMRTIFGNTDIRRNSQFLEELPGELLQNEMPEKLGKTIYLD